MRIFSIILGLSLLLSQIALAHPDHTPSTVPPWQTASPWPDRIIATFIDEPQTALAVTWRTDDSVGRTIAQIAPATADARFDLAAETIGAKTERIDLRNLTTAIGAHDALENKRLGPVHYHSVKFKGLQPDTTYAYRVQGARGFWSEWIQIRTAPEDGPIAFVYFGDAQNGILSHWSRVIRAAHDAAPDARFYLHAGDLVQKGPSDWDWAQWFKAGGFLHAQKPSIPVPGNHEFMPVINPETDEKTRVLTALWRPQFTLPVEKDLPERLHESVYDIRYSDDLHIFVMSSTPASYNRETFEAQAVWLDKQLTESTARWRVVTMHHPYWTPPRKARDAAIGQAFAPIVEKHAVDLVLVGHIHTYARGTQSPDSERTSRSLAGQAKDVDTVFVISASGAKNSPEIEAVFNTDQIGDGKADIGKIEIERFAGNTPMFQVIRIDEGRLTYEARTALGDLYDAFTVEKSADGTKQLTNGDVAYGDMRLFSNTGAYRDWIDLR